MEPPTLGLENQKNRLHASKDYMDLSKDGEELELGLGLSLGGGGVAVKGKSGSACGRILTAKDFPGGFLGMSSGSKRERANSPECVEEGGSVSAAVSQVVGWPPVRAYRMNTMFNQSKTASNVEEGKGASENEKKENSNKKSNLGTEKKESVATAVKGYIKVNMDGLPIGRKLDLNAHKSYETLALALEDMFFKESPNIPGKEQVIKPSPKLLGGSSEFELTYEDKEGDWMLVGDVPWGMFLNTVKRLRIMKTSEANGLAPKLQERNEKQKRRPI